MSDLLAIARRFLAGEKGSKGAKDSVPGDFSPLTPFPPGGTVGAAPLAGLELWDLWGALRLMEEADALVERLGIDGRLPAVRDAAAMVASAYATRDMETVRFAVAEFAAIVRSQTPGTGVSPAPERAPVLFTAGTRDSGRLCAGPGE